MPGWYWSTFTCKCCASFTMLLLSWKIVMIDCFVEECDDCSSIVTGWNHCVCLRTKLELVSAWVSSTETPLYCQFECLPCTACHCACVFVFAASATEMDSLSSGAGAAWSCDTSATLCNIHNIHSLSGSTAIVKVVLGLIDVLWLDLYVRNTCLSFHSK